MAQVNYTGKSALLYVITKIKSYLGEKAPLNSPTFTGIPTAPTATQGTDNTQLATTAFVNAAIAASIGEGVGIQFEVVSSLPDTGKSNVIYLLSKTGTTQDVYDEYVYVNNVWEKIGTTSVDLSGYLKTTDLVEITNEEIDAMFEV